MACCGKPSQQALWNLFLLMQMCYLLELPIAIWWTPILCLNVKNTTCSPECVDHCVLRKHATNITICALSHWGQKRGVKKTQHCTANTSPHTGRPGIAFCSASLAFVRGYILHSAVVPPDMHKEIPWISLSLSRTGEQKGPSLHLL